MTWFSRISQKIFYTRETEKTLHFLVQVCYDTTINLCA